MDSKGQSYFVIWMEFEVFQAFYVYKRDCSLLSLSVEMVQIGIMRMIEICLVSPISWNMQLMPGQVRGSSMITISFFEWEVKLRSWIYFLGCTGSGVKLKTYIHLSSFIVGFVINGPIVNTTGLNLTTNPFNLLAVNVTDTQPKIYFIYLARPVDSEVSIELISIYNFHFFPCV